MKNTSRSRGQSGFTLIEIMIVVVILGILAAVVVPRMFEAPIKARQTKAKQDIRAVISTLSLYRLDNYNYPSTQQGLEALVTKPSGEPEAKNWKQYLDKLPKDPWGNPYQYLTPGTKGGDFDLFSMGSDNRPGGEGEAADIGNWNLDE